MNLKFLLFINIILLNRVYGLFKNASTILDITGIELQEYLKNTSYNLIIFYSETCPYCKRYAPEFILISKLLPTILNKSINIISIDCPKNMYIMRQFDVISFPTLKFIINGKEDYDFETKDLLVVINYIIKKSGAITTEIKDLEIFQTIITASTYLLVGFFREYTGKAFDSFTEFVQSNMEIPWIVVSKEEFFEYYKVKNSSHIIIFRQYDDPRIDYQGEYSADRIARYFRAYASPYITLFYDRESKIPPPFDKQVSDYIVCFTDTTHKKYTLHKALMTKAARQFVGKVKFIYTEVDSGVSYFLTSTFKIKKEDVPTYFYLKYDTNTTDITIYRPKDPKMTSKRVVSFVIQVLSGTVKPFFKSEKLHQRWNKYPVKVLVGDNYDDVTSNINLTVFVQICSELCNSCVNDRHLWHELALSYKDKPDIWIASIDLSKNDIRNVKIKFFPQYRLYPKNTNKSIMFIGNRTFEDFRRFVNSNGTINPSNNFEHPELKQEKNIPPEYITSEEIKPKMQEEDMKILMEYIKQSRKS